MFMIMLDLNSLEFVGALKWTNLYINLDLDELLVVI